MNIFQSKQNYFQNVKMFKQAQLFKYDFILPHSIELCIDSFTPLNQVKKFDPYLIGSKKLSYYNIEEMELKNEIDEENFEFHFERSNANYITDIKLPGIKYPRKSYESVTSFYDEDKNWFRIIKSFYPNFIGDEIENWKNYHTIDDFSFYLQPQMIGYKFTKISSEKTKFSQIQIFQPTGNFLLSKFDNLFLSSNLVSKKKKN